MNWSSLCCTLLELKSGETVRPSGQWIYSLFCALAVTALPGCNQRVGAVDTDNPPVTLEDGYRRQLDLDVAAIIKGMSQAHGAQVVALTPGP
jgi:hypothetical protein